MLIPIITILLISAIVTWTYFSVSSFRNRVRGYDDVADLQRMLNLPHDGRAPRIRPNPVGRLGGIRGVELQNESAESILKRELEANASVVGRAILSWRELEEE